MQMLAGMKSYLLAAAMVAYAAFGFFYLHSIDQPTFAGFIAAAGALVGIRSGLTTEFQKVLAAFGIDVAGGAAATPKTVQDGGAPIVAKLYELAQTAKTNAAKVAGVLLAVIIAAPMLTGCQTYDALFGSGAKTTLCDTPSQCVYQAKGVFAAGLALVNGYGGLTPCPTNAPICKDENLVASIRTQAHNVQTELDAADLLVNSALLPSGAPATPADMKTAADNATKDATDFKTAAVALPHS